MKQKREIELDVLKFLGIMLIILAHVCPQESFIFNLRNFDVPMMVIVSGYLFSQRYAGNQDYSFLSYLRKRFLRLITPVWCFFIFFFIAVGAIEKFQGNKYPFSIREVINAFLLLDGAGWIIRVFFLVAILSIFLIKLRKFAVKDTYFLILLSCIYLGYEVVLKFCNDLQLPVFNLAIIDFFVRKIWFLGYHIFTQKILFYTIPYGCIFGLGMLLPSMKKKLIFLFSVFFGVCFLLLALYYSQNSGYFVATQNFKYPPQFYYLSYGILMSMLMYLLVNFLSNKLNQLFQIRNLLVNFIVFVSESSLWIYLWHTFFWKYENFAALILPKSDSWIVIYVYIVLVSIATTYLQKKLINSLIYSTRFGQKYSQMLSLIFLK